MKAGVVFLICILIGFTCCEQIDLPADVPNCVKKLIRDSNGTPQSVWRYQYQNETVFLIIPVCCDQYISVYSSTCNFICAPSGGLTGKGDGKCPTFNDEATEGVIIWKAD